MERTKTKKRWMKPRHRIVCDIARLVLRPYCLWKYGIRVDRFREQGDRAYLVLMNHQTPFDQFFVGLSFRGPIYFLATEDIFSNGWVSSLIRWLVAPIPIIKQTTDINAVMNCIKVAREGGTLAIAPEGNRTYSGKTEYMSDSIAALAKKMKLPIALFCIEGGYGVQPRWSDGIRKGNMRGYVSRVIEPEEYAGMKPSELFEQIKEGLYVNEAAADGMFHSKKKAEYLERAMYVCPFCGLTQWESHGNRAACLTCGREILYGEDKTLTGIGYEFPFRFMAEWYDRQNAFVSSLDLQPYMDVPMYTDTACVSEVIIYKRKVPVYKNAQILLYGDRVEILGTDAEPMILPFKEITAAAVLGRNKLNLYHNQKVYQFKGGKRFNALKYVNIYFRHKHITRGENDDQFLGL